LTSIVPPQNRHSSKYFTPAASPRTSIEGNLDKALEYLHISIKGKYDMLNTIYLLIGKIYHKNKQYGQAKKYFSMCIHIPNQRKSQIDIVNEAKILLKDKKIQNSSFEVFARNLKKQY